MEFFDSDFLLTINFIKLSSLIVVIYVIKALSASQQCSPNMKYYQAYFFLALFLSTLHVLAAAFNLPVEISHLIIFYILTSSVLVFALNEKIRKRSIFLFASISFLLFLISAFIFSYSDYAYMLIHAIFSLVIYGYLFYIGINKAKELDNIGFKVISAGFLLIILVAFLEFKELFYNDVSKTFSYAQFSANSGFILVILGFLTINIIHEHKYFNNLAYVDSLTGMNNRRGLDFLLNTIIPSFNREKRCFSVLSIDIDFFKKVNDTYGHDGGDIVLQEFAKVIKKNHRNNDISCRFGGEEFIIILPDTNKVKAIALSEKLRKNIENNTIVHGQININITASFGVATSCAEINIDDLIKDSDRALYIAKYAGRNQVVHVDDHCII